MSIREGTRLSTVFLRTIAYIFAVSTGSSPSHSEGYTHG